MIFNARCWTPQAAALVIAMIFLSACVRADSEAQVACPPVVEYSRLEQAQVTEEVAALPQGARIIDWLSDYAVMRDQARVCSGLSVSTTR